ncbi:MAG: hypothetical protein A2W93_00480 [Bacteroidetes bacterium GWF2_43_63]|nr:MAG: hypothetical protein A2W94_13040 [Bacteroidetes bacterium GWE2_42_42]OFY53878.1 MAG: hypothetical protein A2W93_00480 [Bacteroidetes bacterium GWF2_43_63]
MVLIMRSKLFTQGVSLLFSISIIGLTAYGWLHLDESSVHFFTFTHEGMLLLSVLALIALPTFYHGFRYTQNSTVRHYNIYHVSMIALMTFMTGAYLSNSMTMLWVFVEATTLSVAALIYHDRTAQSLEATWKYVFICSVGISIAYVGVLLLGFIYGRYDAASLTFDEFSVLVSQANPIYLKVAFVFVLVGFSTKMGLFPMHSVTIDAHSVAPAPVSALISTTLMNVGFLAIFRVFTLFSSTEILPFMQHSLVLTGILSLLIAAGYMLKAYHIKRMFAYSSLEMMGLVAIAMGSGHQGYYAAILLVLLHTLVKSSIFFHMGQFKKVNHSYELKQVGNYMKNYSAGGMLLLLCVVFILAIPPSGIFISEFLIFKTLIAQQHWITFIVTALLLTAVIYALLTRILHILFSDPAEPMSEIEEPGKVKAIETVPQFILLAIVAVLCFYQPPFLVDAINASITALPK